MKTFTNKQIANWMTYEEVRLSGEYNMLDSRAREMTGLQKEDYFFVLKNYSELSIHYMTKAQGKTK